MAEPFLLIDGYNLMHAVGFARSRYSQGQLEQARQRLLKFLLVHLRDSELPRTTVIFDAANAPVGLPGRSNLHGMAIVFARPGGDADTLIEEMIAEHSAPRQLRIISSDHRLQKAARRRKSQFIDSEDFVAELKRRLSARANDTESQTPDPPDSKSSGVVSQSELDKWLTEFGDIPEAADLEKGVDRLQSEVDRLQSEIDQMSDDEEI